jgi:hypothetical protein
MVQAQHAEHVLDRNLRDDESGYQTQHGTRDLQRYFTREYSICWVYVGHVRDLFHIRGINANKATSRTTAVNYKLSICEEE